MFVKRLLGWNAWRSREQITPNKGSGIWPGSNPSWLAGLFPWTMDRACCNAALVSRTPGFLGWDRAVFSRGSSTWRAFFLRTTRAMRPPRFVPGWELGQSTERRGRATLTEVECATNNGGWKDLWMAESPAPQSLLKARFDLPRTRFVIAGPGALVRLHVAS